MALLRYYGLSIRRPNFSGNTEYIVLKHLSIIVHQTFLERFQTQSQFHSER